MSTPPAASIARHEGTLQRLFEMQRAAFARERYPSLAVRRDRLARLRKLVAYNEGRLVAAIDQDFGHRSAHETRLAELYIVAAEIAPRAAASRALDAAATRGYADAPDAGARAHRAATARRGRRHQPVELSGAAGTRVRRSRALAAGNRVLLKPSELTPATSGLLQELVAASFRGGRIRRGAGRCGVRPRIHAASVRSPVLHRLDARSGGRSRAPPRTT